MFIRRSQKSYSSFSPYFRGIEQPFVSMKKQQSKTVQGRYDERRLAKRGRRPALVVIVEVEAVSRQS